MQNMPLLPLVSPIFSSGSTGNLFTVFCCHFPQGMPGTYMRTSTGERQAVGTDWEPSPLIAVHWAGRLAGSGWRRQINCNQWRTETNDSLRRQRRWEFSDSPSHHRSSRASPRTLLLHASPYTRLKQKARSLLHRMQFPWGMDTLLSFTDIYEYNTHAHGVL